MSASHSNKSEQVSADMLNKALGHDQFIRLGGHFLHGAEHGHENTNNSNKESPPIITKTDTFREGDLEYVKVYFKDPDQDASGFGFTGIYGSPWAQEQHPFTSPSFGTVSPGVVEYPFNLGGGAGTPSDIAFWISDSEGQNSAPVAIHLAYN
jgi:hypothetical protein